LTSGNTARRRSTSYSTGTWTSSTASRTHYRGYGRNHISPYLGKIRVGHLEPETLDAFYPELRRCRKHCTTPKTIDHRTNQPHNCDDRCRKHQYRPLSAHHGPAQSLHLVRVLRTRSPGGAEVARMISVKNYGPDTARYLRRRYR